MSLINDALRRANSDKAREAQPVAPVPPMQPVETGSPRSSVLPWAVLVLGVGVLVVAATLWFRGKPGTKELVRNESAAKATALPTLSDGEVLPNRDESRSAAVQPEQLAASEPARPSATAVSEPEKVSSTVSTPVNPAVPDPKASEVKAAAVSPPPVSEPKPRPATEPREAEPRLQAIYYRFRNPTVVINGKTLSQGQSVDGIKVVSIQRTSVEVVQAGKYRTLTLQD